MENLRIKRDNSYPYRPQANPVETWMQPLGKCMKIANHKRVDKEKALKDLLTAYRSMPHPVTGLSPGEKLFRHGYCGIFSNRKNAPTKILPRRLKR